MSTSTRRVILYGHSLIMEGVRTSLAACPDLEIIRVDAVGENLFKIIRAVCPAVFIFDLQAMRSDFQLMLLQLPELQLIGIDPETQQAMVWSGRQEAAVVTADLISLISPKNSH